MTQKTRAEFQSGQETTFADNTSGDISAADLRGEIGDLADSALFPQDITYATRGAAVTAISGGMVPVAGRTYHIAGLAYIGVASSTEIADLPGLEPAGDTYPDHWAFNTVPGTTDMTAALEAMEAYLSGTGRTGRLLPGAYYIASTTAVIDVNGWRLVGAGMGLSSIYSDSEAGSGSMVLRGDGASLEDLSLTGAAQLSIQTGNNMALRRVEISNAAIADNADWRSGIVFSDTADIDGLEIDGCNFHHVNLGIFTSNSFGTSGNQIRNARITNNWFHHTIGTACSLNSSFATSGAVDVWKGVIVSGNHFSDHIGGAGKRPIALGFDSCTDLIFSNNTFDGYGGLGSAGGSDAEYAVHLENLGGNCVVNGNVITGAIRGVVIYPLSGSVIVTDNVIEGMEGRDYTATPSGFTSATNSNGIGIRVQSSGNGETDSYIIANNVVTNFPNGIVYGGAKKDAIVQGNTIALCTAALVPLHGSGGAICKDNTARLCKHVVRAWDTTSNAMMENISAIDCALLRDPTFPGASLMIDGLKWTASGNAVTAVNTWMSLFLLPSWWSDTMRVSAITYNDDNPATSCITLLSATWDGTTLTPARVYHSSGGSPTAAIPATTPMQDSSGTLQLRIFNADTVDHIATWSLKFNGVMAWT